MRPLLSVYMYLQLRSTRVLPCHVPQETADVGNTESASWRRFRRSICALPSATPAAQWAEPSLFPPSVARGDETVSTYGKLRLPYAAVSYHILVLEALYVQMESIEHIRCLW